VYFLRLFFNVCLFNLIFHGDIFLYVFIQPNVNNTFNICSGFFVLRLVIIFEILRMLRRLRFIKFFRNKKLNRSLFLSTSAFPYFFLILFGVSFIFSKNVSFCICLSIFTSTLLYISKNHIQQREPVKLILLSKNLFREFSRYLVFKGVSFSIFILKSWISCDLFLLFCACFNFQKSCITFFELLIKLKFLFAIKKYGNALWVFSKCFKKNFGLYTIKLFLTLYLTVLIVYIVI
jgi:hypothetical protein